MKTAGSDPLDKAMMVVHVKDKDAMSAISEIVTNAGDGYVQIVFNDGWTISGRFI